MASWQEEPRKGSTVWSRSRNGIIKWINYEDRIAHVDFYDKGSEQFELDVFIGTFDERLNQWILVE